MKNEDEKLEAELWEMASKADGEEKVDALIQLSYRSFNRGDHAESLALCETCLLYTSPSPRDRQKSRMPSSA